MEKRVVNVACGQLGPIARSESKAQVVRRLIALLREARSRGSDVVVFPELALTTFFPRWVLDTREEIDSYFETEMPGPVTLPLFEEAARLGIGFYLGYAELAKTPSGAPRYFNSSIIVDKTGRIVGKYRKIHLPGYSEPQPHLESQHLEKRYFEPGNLGFPVFEAFGCVAGMCICNDRRWPETYRVMSLQAVDLVMVGYNTPTGYGRLGEPRHLPLLHNHLSLQAAAYQNTCWVAAAAKAGVEEGIHMIGGSCIVAPTGEIAVQALSEDDEVINYVCDMSLADGYRGNIFNYERHRRPEHYRAIVDRVGASRSPL